ncbi:MAG: UDP-N-acetylmuramoyl-L-alanyl-D-glutamate--2,6-diaminopimelate ligase [Xanthomonadales bacterium]|nr:UDP-N-acetylmuramoyl-L-alanyl-D-glutamate--2,6-diaminopimelate ligase [Xanthomonadales bacterium]
MMPARHQRPVQTLRQWMQRYLERSDIQPQRFDIELLPDIAIRHLCADSRQVQAGDAFIALRGGQYDGVDYAQAAIEAGAVVIVTEVRDTLPELAVPVVQLPQLAEQLGFVAASFYGDVSHTLPLIGITGTNGKSSCAHFLAQAWPLCDRGQAGMVGTLGYGPLTKLNDSSRTTPDAVSVQRLLAELSGDELAMAAMEVSSHALEQQRVQACRFAAGVFTNLSRDHLDYHGTMAAYAAAKAKLFTEYRCPLAVINIDDEHGQALTAALRQQALPGQQVLSYSCTRAEADVYGELLAMDRQGLRIAVRSPWGRDEVQVAMAGRFQAFNLMAVFTVLCGLDCDFNTALTVLSQLQAVPGRMQSVQPALSQAEVPLVLVDYAHTPAALEQALQTARELTQGQLWCVFGCGGDRDRGKRPQMGALAAQLADQIVVTSDNPRFENEQAILDDIKSGIRTTHNVNEFVDRAEAIAWSIAQANADDVVLVAGKGHETYQEVAGVRRPFDDVAQARRALGCAA